MATIKSYTDLDQSKKLAEILPLESADMHYCLENRDVATGYEIGITPYTKVKSFIGKCNIVDVKPSWSLAALLDVIPCGQVNKISDSNKYEASSWNDSGLEIPNYTTVEGFDNPVDACVAMIEKLNELKLL